MFSRENKFMLQEQEMYLSSCFLMLTLRMQVIFLKFHKRIENFTGSSQKENCRENISLLKHFFLKKYFFIKNFFSIFTDLYCDGACDAKVNDFDVLSFPLCPLSPMMKFSVVLCFQILLRQTSPFFHPNQFEISVFHLFQLFPAFHHEQSLTSMAHQNLLRQKHFLNAFEENLENIHNFKLFKSLKFEFSENLECI